MHKLSLSLHAVLALGISGSLAHAQVAPGQFAPFANDTVFTKANLTSLGVYRAGATNKGILQINFSKVPGVDKVGQWTVSLTVNDLSPRYGGAASGGTYVVMGQYDTNKTPHTFTANTQANLMNNTANGVNFGLMIEPRDGMCCAVDQRDGIYFSRRLNATGPFPRPVRVSFAPGTPGLPAGNYVHPVPCFLDKTTLVMIYTDRSANVVWRQLKLAFDQNGIIRKAEMQKVNVITTTTRPHSPTPIIDRNGNVQGLWLAIHSPISSGADSDMYFLPGLTPKDKPIKLYDNSGLMGSGGVCGGRLFFANNSPPNGNSAASVGRVAWLVGSNTSLGGPATMTCGVHNPKRPLAPFLTRIALSLQLNAGVNAGSAIPGWNGLYALNASILVFSHMLTATADEVAHWTRPVPRDNALIGVRVSVQGISL
ncbi:MAG: hypothetical protein ACYST0_06975, partial [Planctomycetota bacterium]